MPVTAQQQWLITWSSPRVTIDSEYWETFSGYEESVEAQEHYDGGSNEPEIWFDRTKRADVTISRAWRAPRDGNLLKLISSVLGSGEKGTLTVTHVDRDLVPDEEPQVITGYLKAVKGGQADANQSGSKSMIEVTIRPSGIA
jgi:hypothetical protein